MTGKTSRRRGLADRLKNIAIALLIVSALALVRQNGLLSLLLVHGRPDNVRAGGLSQSEGRGGGDARAGLSSAERPFCMAVTWDGGARRGEMGGELGALFSEFSFILGEALGSAGAPETLPLSRWRAALMKEGVFFDYLTPLPLSALSVWLGTRSAAGISGGFARRICLTAEDGRLELYFSDGKSCYRCETAADASALSSRIAGASPGEGRAAFVFENADAFPGIDGDSLIMPGGVLTAPRLEAKNPAAANLERIQEAFQMNPGLANDYFQEGTRVFIESGRGDSYTELRVGGDGSAVFKQYGANVLLAPPDADAVSLLDFAWSVAKMGPGALAGRAELYISAAELDFAGGTHKISFDYEIDGVPIICAGGPALTMEIKDGAVYEIRALFREFTYAQGVLTEIPQRQALSAAVGKGGEAILAYEETEGSVRLKWSVRRG